MVTIQLTVNLEARSLIRSKCLSLYTLVFCRHHHFLFTHSLPLPRSKGSTWLVWSYMNTILLHPMTQNELPSSQVFAGLQGHVTSPEPSHLSHSTSQCPHSGLWSPQPSGSSYLTCCSSVMSSKACFWHRYLLSLLPGTPKFMLCFPGDSSGKESNLPIQEIPVPSLGWGDPLE